MGLKNQPLWSGSQLSLTKVRKPSKAVVLKSFLPIKWTGIDVLPFSSMRSKKDALTDHSLDSKTKRRIKLNAMALIWSLRFKEKSTTTKITLQDLFPWFCFYLSIFALRERWASSRKQTWIEILVMGQTAKKRNWRGYNWTDSPPIWPWNKTWTNEIATVKI